MKKTIKSLPDTIIITSKEVYENGSIDVQIPIGYYLQSLIIEQIGTPTTGSLTLGTTAGGTDVRVAMAITASTWGLFAIVNLTPLLISRSANQYIFVTTTTSWGTLRCKMHMRFVRGLNL